MDLLPLRLIGWLYVAGCGLAIALGAWLVIGAHLAGEETRRQLAAHVPDDTLLFGVWVMGFAGGVGLLLQASWSYALLELFCWVLGVLATMTAYTHWRAAPPPRGRLALGLLLFVVPLVALCAATILTLRNAIH